MVMKWRAEKGLAGSNDPMAFLAIYDNLDQQGLNPAELFQKGVEEYISNWIDAKENGLAQADQE